MATEREQGNAVNHTAMGTGKRTDGETSLVRLATRAQPPRVRSLLEGVLERTAGFESALSMLFDDVAQHLFNQAERARSNEQQLRLLEAIREIRRGKADVLPRFLLHVESSLALLDRVAPAKPAEFDAASRDPTKLELVDSGDLEISLAMQDIGSKAEIRHSQILHLLGHRLGVIGGQPAFEAESMPLGPMALTAAFNYALADLDLSLNDRISALQAFDRVVMAPIGTFYDNIDQYLVGQRVLPNLQFRVRRAGANDTTGESATATEKQRTEPAAPGPGRSSASQTTDAHPSSAQTAAAMPVQADGAHDATLFATLRGLLAERRRGLGMHNVAPESAYQASRNDLQSVLGSLQASPVGTIQQDGRAVSRSIGHLKQDLLNRLREQSPQGRAPMLAEEDSDTIDLVGMLFDYIGQNLPAQNGVRDLMSKLQVPVLRTAIGDKDFFTQRNHPARMLLNSVAEAGSLWLGDEDADRGLADKMGAMVDRVSCEFDGDLSLIDNLLGDLGRYMGQVTRRAEMAERRHIDAAKGREKLDLARSRANAAVERLLKRSKPAPMVRAVLEQAWTDVLALTLLRQGEDSQNYRRCLAVADQLLQIGTGSDVTRIDAKVREEVRNGLLQVGLHNDEVEGLVGKLFDPARAEKKTSHTELAFTLKNKPRLGGESAPIAADASEPPVPPATSLNAEEKEMLQRIRTLPFGTWFEFVTNQQGNTVRRKLAWFSTVTGRCLFVNQRGARADERSMEQLARELVRGQVRLFSTESGTLIDRAWKAIMNTLQQFSGHASQPASS
jgi:hypothetical protein